MEYKAIIRNDTKGTWIQSVFDDEIVETSTEGEAFVFEDEHCAKVSLDYLNGTLDDSYILIRR